MQGFCQLPQDLWARILRNLSTQDLLSARLACKSFVRLSDLDSLKIDVKPTSAEAISSLMLFTSRHCTAAQSPKLDLTIRTLPEGTAYPGIMLASPCANLQRFKISNLQLELPVAQACLRLVPESLEVLELFTCASLVEEAAWQRLRALRVLELKWPTVAQPKVHAGTGLMLLPSLTGLVFTRDGSDMTDKLDGSKFSMDQLRSLRLCQDPFFGRLDLRKTPKIRCISWKHRGFLPDWLSGQPLGKLVLSSSYQLDAIDLDTLQIRSLGFTYKDRAPGWDVSALLAMPCLEEFQVEAKPSVPAKVPMTLSCMAAEYHTLMNRGVTLNFMVPVELTIRRPGHCLNEVIWRVRLRSNGHTEVCRCDDCRSHW